MKPQYQIDIIIMPGGAVAANECSAVSPNGTTFLVWSGHWNQPPVVQDVTYGLMVIDGNIVETNFIGGQGTEQAPYILQQVAT